MAKTQQNSGVGTEVGGNIKSFVLEKSREARNFDKSKREHFRNADPLQCQ